MENFSKDFVDACIEQNSVSELKAADLAEHADKIDCKTWGITPYQWRNSISLALDCKLNDGEQDD